MASTLEQARLDEATAKERREQATTAAREATAARVAAEQALVDAPAEAPSEEANARWREREAAVIAARSEEVSARHALRRAEAALSEASERASRLAGIAATLAQLDRAMAAVRARDQALIDIGIVMYAKLGEALDALRDALLAADRVWRTLPVDSRRDVDPPFSLAHFAGVGPAHPRLLALVEAAVVQRLGGYTPNSAEGKAALGARQS